MAVRSYKDIASPVAGNDSDTALARGGCFHLVL
jgi:hypothetical protein